MIIDQCARCTFALDIDTPMIPRPAMPLLDRDKVIVNVITAAVFWSSWLLLQHPLLLHPDPS